MIPVTQVNAEVDVVDPRYEPIGEEDKAVWESCRFLFDHGTEEPEAESCNR